ncbi:GNAT family N-acetyltransferase [Rhodococcoides corynebacterioides]|uniref:N-acetyltransferase domain-containing protein n=1 Tax=Rhodococcoides corynebacterioides TaxID=53972 RepID=A0ABS7P1A9_9NOCA|nr:hypothetical protein [Rhodococcus corynebacterioides]MBY6366192.1 hypothetical protein [Rhodococcus corynebacterioides]MBY6408931.1 hypothetical protein [Rhodococcus corynebacterioides]
MTIATARRSDVEVRPVRTRRDWARFRRVPFLVYRDDPNWIPGDAADVGDVLVSPSAGTRSRITTRAFLAYRDGRPVGRVAAIHDHVFDRRYAASTVFFGYLEAVDDAAVTHALLDAVADWGRARGLTTVAGPMSPSLLWSAGTLVHGNDIPPLVGMPHNPAYYAEHLESWGLVGVKDFHSFFSEDPHTLVQTPRFARKYEMGKRWKARSSVIVRPMDPARFDEDIERVRVLYNTAFAGFWGFTPVDADEMRALADTMRPVLDPEIVLFAELDGQLVGFVMGIPDVNRAALGAVRSRFGLVRDLHTLLRWRGPGGARRRTHVRLDMMFVDPACPDRGVSALLIFELFARIHDRGYHSIEAAPVQTDGGWFRSVLASYPVDPTRTYRIYERVLTP